MKKNNGYASRILKNSAWEGSQQTISMAATSVINLMLIVSMPVSEYGIYSYATALVAMGSTIMSAGLTGLAMKMLVANVGDSRIIVSSLLFLREIFALLALTLIVMISLTSGSNTVVMAVLVAGLALVFRGWDAPELWYMSRLKTRRSAGIRMVLTLVFFSIRIFAVFVFPSLWLFLTLLVLESSLVSLGILIRYLRESGSPGLSKPSASHVKLLIRDSFPLMLSGLANQINLRGDVVVLQSMLGSGAVGVYSAAARISEVTYFLPGVIMNSTFPVLINVRNSHGAESAVYRDFIQKSYDRALWTGVLLAVVVGSCGYFFIGWVFGEEYAVAKMVLLIHLIACPFVFMAAVYSKWIIAEGLFWSSLVRHGLGAVCNIALNIVLIPHMGIIGSALATVFSYVVASYIACFFGRRTSVAGVQMSIAMLAPIRLILRRRNKSTNVIEVLEK